MLRVAEQFAKSDTGRQRPANEDAHFARAPLFVVADGMGGAQAGEVASRMAVEAFEPGLPDGGNPEERLAERAREANLKIHDHAQSDSSRAGMGTTLSAAYVGEDEVSIAHVGDSRIYLWRDGELTRLTRDHTLVEELVRRGKLTEEQAEDHPQRSIITRALGPEPAVDIDTRTQPARPGDVFLLCSDGLTSMVPEARVAEILVEASSLDAAGRALVDAANAAGGRDNITVVLFRLEDVGGRWGGAGPEQPTAGGRRAQRPPRCVRRSGHGRPPVRVQPPPRPRSAAAPAARRGAERARRLGLPAVAAGPWWAPSWSSCWRWSWPEAGSRHARCTSWGPTARDW